MEDSTSTFEPPVSYPTNVFPPLIWMKTRTVPVELVSNIMYCLVDESFL